MAKVCAKDANRIPVICGIDGNVANFGSGCDFLGGLGVKYSPPLANFHLFYDFLERFGLCSFNTFVDKCSHGYSSEPYTYQDKRGGVHTIDYLLGCRNAHCLDGTVKRVDELVIDVDIRDHIPIQATLTWAVIDGFVGRPNRKKVGYDTKKFGDVDCASVFCDLLDNKDPIPVSADVTSHCHAFQQHLYECMCQAFPKDKVSIRAIGVSSDHLSTFLEARNAKKDVGRFFRGSVAVVCVPVLGFGPAVVGDVNFRLSLGLVRSLTLLPGPMPGPMPGICRSRSKALSSWRFAPMLMP